MATYTTNYNLKKPTYAEPANVMVINENMDMVDDIMHSSQVSLADAYDLNSTYNTGDKVMYEMLMYKCLEDNVTGAWDSTKWERTTAVEGSGGNSVEVDEKFQTGLNVADIDIDGDQHSIKVPYMTGATSQADGAGGLVPAPEAGDEDKYLKGNGQWATVSGGGGSDVSITPSLVSGTKVADYEIDGVAGAIYAPTAPPLDATLTLENAAAQAKAVGDAVNVLNIYNRDHYVVGYSISGKYKILSTDITQGAITNQGVDAEQPKRLRTSNYIPIEAGVVINFTAGTIIDSYGYNLYDMNKNHLGQYGWFTDTQKVINSNGFIRFFYRSGNGTTDITPAQYDANVFIRSQAGTIIDSFNDRQIVDIFNESNIENGTVYVSGISSQIAYSDTTLVARTKQGITISLKQGDSIVINNGYELRLIKTSPVTQITDYTKNIVSIETDGEYVFAIRKETTSVNISVQEAINNVYIRKKYNIEREEISKIATEYEPSNIFGYKSNGKVPSVKDTYYNVYQEITYAHADSDGFQSFDIYDSKLYVCSSESKIMIYNIGTSTLVKTLSVSLGHANSCQFSDEFYNGNTVPLLYVSDYYNSKVYVVNILSDSATVIRTISMQTEDTGYYIDICIDNVNNRLITLGYKERSNFDRANNKTIISLWDLSSITLNSGIDYSIGKIKTFEIPFIFCMADCKYYNHSVYALSSASPTFVEQYGENKTRIYNIDVENALINGYLGEMPDYYSNREVEGISIWNNNIVLLPFGGDSGRIVFN